MSRPAGGALGIAPRYRHHTAAWWWYAYGLLMIAAMWYLRMVVFPTQIVPLTYALPLLACVWSRDLRLLWGMAVVFIMMVMHKMSLLSRIDSAYHAVLMNGGMQMTNILVAAAVTHAVIVLRARLESTVSLLQDANSELEASNEELAAREEEITQQNEELQSQAEELEQQTEELNSQTEELQGLNDQLALRERTLSDLLEAASHGVGEAETLLSLGNTIERLFGARVRAAALLEPVGDEMTVHPILGLPENTSRMKRDLTLAALVLDRDRPGALPDLRQRPDLAAPEMPDGSPIRSVAAAPIRVGSSATGALEIYSASIGEWSEHELRLVQWVAKQCGRLWATSRLHSELEKQQHLLRTVTESSVVALLLTDERGICTYLNAAARQLAGYDLDELQDRPLVEYLRPRRADGDHAPFPPPENGDSSTRITKLDDQVILHKSGRRIPVHCSTSPVIAGGVPVATVIEIRDESEIHRQALEREQLLESERSARADAERANRAKDEFVAMLSHELRTPLNAVLGWAVLLRKSASPSPDELQRGLEIIERNARLQGHLISDLLDMSRIIAGKVRLDVQPVDLTAVVERALEDVRMAAELKSVRIERVVESVDRAVMGDPQRLQQVVWNLLSNAIKFTPRDGCIQVVVSRVASFVQVTVSDNGEGIDPELLPHLFERYRQADGSESRRHGGLGLGLAIAKHLVDIHGGTIHVRSDGLGKGASFSVMLPVKAVETPPDASGPHPRSEQSGNVEIESPSVTGLNVLIVDDDRDARELIARILKEQGATVRTAGSGEEALELFQEQQPELMMSDIGMPGMDGYTLIRQIRERWPESRRAVPAIALTAFARSEDRTRALLAGFQSHIAKPVEYSELMATIASLGLANPRPAPEQS